MKLLQIFFILASSLLDQLVDRHDAMGRVSVREFPDVPISTAIASRTFLELVGIIVLIAIAQTIVKAMQVKVRQIKSIPGSV